MAYENRGRPEAGTHVCHPAMTKLVGEGGVDGGGGGGLRATMKMFKLRALRAPMYDARTGKKYREVSLVPGRVHTFGRSRSSCDVVFSDSRVSRQHCQVYWDKTTNQLFLFEGAPADFKSGKVNSSMLLAPHKANKPVLNGLYVDGKKVAQGGCRALNPGSEVSLIACTKEAQTVNDPEFGDAVGFFVDVVDLCQLYSSTDVNMDRLRTDPKSDPKEKGCRPSSTYQRERQRPLVSFKQGTWKAADDKSSISFERRSSYSSTATVKKKRKRSTAEIMGLLRQQEAPSAVTKVNKNQRLDEGNTIIRGSERQLDKMELFEEPGGKISSKSDPTFQGTELLFDKSSRSRMIDGEAVTPALAIMPLTKPYIEAFSRVPDSQMVTKPENVRSESRVKDDSRSVGRTMDQACPRAEVEVEEDRSTLNDLGRNIMELAQEENISSANAGAFDGKWCGSGLLLNRLQNMETDIELPCQQTVSLQELLNPTNGLLGIFAATLTSDIPWFLSSHNISPDLPVTVACHDRDRCWSTAEESRTSSPFASWPNVQVVYPVFPDSCCFATKKRQGIGCHHPKIFLLPRKDSIRLIVTSANLTCIQWLHITNSVWWQDFPRKAVRDYETLFSTSAMGESGSIHGQTQSDFAMNLSSFVASLVADVPSAAHWALDLAEFDFSNAEASLVTSIPGLYGCQCPLVPSSLTDVMKSGLVTAENGAQKSRKFLAAVNSSVVGMSHRFKGSADPRGERVRALAAILSSNNLQEGSLVTVRLERITTFTADPNAVSVIVSSDATQGAVEMGTCSGFLQTTEDSEHSAQWNSVHIGFLPRSVAKWVAPLYDNGLCTFTACIQPSEVISLATGLSKIVPQLVLYVFEGRSFSHLSTSGLSPHDTVALCGLLRSMQRPLGLWRLHQILSKFKWQNAAETNFVFGSSSIGTSLDTTFLAAFSVAAGKKAISSELSEESDSQWGAWTTEHEANAPSIGVVFPTIERVKAAKGGPFGHHGILCFAESTWERLKPACLLHDAVPFPEERVGIPMHVKVAQRRFQNHRREAPYGWIYCGSHNFSPAAWGKPHAKAVHPCKCSKTALGCTLLISNYELGLIFVEPPPNEGPRKPRFRPLALKPNVDGSKTQSELDNNGPGLDKFVLPFCVPAPKYADTDQPATKKALYGVLESWRTKLALAADSVVSEDSDTDMASSDRDEEGDGSQLCIESEESIKLGEEYGETLWTQIDPSTLLQ